MTHIRLLTIAMLTATCTLVSIQPAGAEEQTEPTAPPREKSRKAAKPEQSSFLLRVGAECESVARVLTTLHEMHGDRTPLIFEHDSTHGTVTIIGPKRTMKELDKRVQAENTNALVSAPKENDESNVAAPETVVRVFPIQHVSAHKLAETVRNLYGGRRGGTWVIVADEASNSVVVNGPVELIEDTEQLIAQLDRPNGPDEIERTTTMMVQVSHARAGDVGDLVHHTSKAMAWEVRAVADNRTNTVLVMGPAIQVEKTRAFIALWDVAVEPEPKTDPSTDQVSERKVEAGELMANETSAPEPLREAKRKPRKANAKTPEVNSAPP